MGRKRYEKTGEYIRVGGKALPLRWVPIKGTNLILAVPAYVVRIPGGWQLRKDKAENSLSFFDGRKGAQYSLNQAIEYLKLGAVNIDPSKPFKLKGSELNCKTYITGCVGVQMHWATHRVTIAPRLVINVLYPLYGLRGISIGRGDKLTRDDIEHNLKLCIGVRTYLVDKHRGKQEHFPELDKPIRELAGAAAEYIQKAKPDVNYKTLFRKYQDGKRKMRERDGVAPSRVRPQWAEGTGR